MSSFNKHSVGGMIDEYMEDADKRCKQGQRHELKTILILILIGYLCGKYTYRSICYFYRPDLPLKEGLKKRKSDSDNVDVNNIWYKDKENAIKKAELKTAMNYALLSKYIDLPYGVPHYSTFSRALEKADMNVIIDVLYEFFVMLLPEEGFEELSIDGKALNGAINKSVTGKSLYIVNAYSVAARLFLISFPVGNKTNEEKALWEQLPNLLLGNKSIVTTDAMGTNKEILQTISRLGSYFLMPLKENNKKIEQDLRRKGIELGCSDPEYPHLTDVPFHTTGEIAGVIIDTKSVIVEEDNEKPLADKKSNRSSIEEHIFFENLYDYSDVAQYTDSAATGSGDTELPLISVDDSIDEGKKYLLKIGKFLVPMYYLHGRFERREVEVFSLTDYFDNNPIGNGFDCATDCAMITRYRAEKVRKNKKIYWAVTVSRTPYLTNIKGIDTKKTLNIILGHWAVLS